MKGPEQVPKKRRTEPDLTGSSSLFKGHSLKQAFVVKEILDRPRALRPFQRNGWFR